MLVVETVARIRREFFVKGKSIKEIVRSLGVSRNTVRKVLRSAICRSRCQAVNCCSIWSAGSTNRPRSSSQPTWRSANGRRCSVMPR